MEGNNNAGDGQANRKIHPSAIKRHVLGFVAFILFAVVGVFGYLNFGEIALYIFFAAEVLIVVLTIADGYIYERFNEIDVSDTSVAIKKGVLSVRSIVVPYSKITDMNIKRSFLDRILRVGLLEINTAGSEKMEVVFPNVRKEDLLYITKVFREKGAKHGTEK